MKTRGIYLIKCTPSGRCYAGSSNACETRWRQHQNKLRKGVHHSLRLQRAWNKHGEQEFEFEVVEVVAEGEDIFAAEQRWIDSHGKYNASRVARGREAGFKNPHPGPSPEVRARIAAALRGRPGHNRGIKASPETCAKIGASKIGNTNRLGISHSAHTKAKIAASLTGRPSIPATIAKMQAALLEKGRTPEHCAAISAALKGRIISQEARDKTAATLRGRKLSDEAKAALRDGWTPERRAAQAERVRGRTTSEETKQKQSAALRGRTKSPETRARMVEAQRKRAGR